MKKKEAISNKTLLMSKSAPFSYVESYKSLRTNLLFASVNKECKKIAITSSIANEGKSTIAINLAISMASTGSKVLLIDCDLRKPALHRYLRIGNNASIGLTSILAGMKKAEESIVCLDELGISFLPAGPIPPNPTELLGSKRLKDVLDSLIEQFDYILLDTPPVSVVTDAAVLAQITDGILFIIRQNYTKIDAAKIAIKKLEDVHATIIGSVLNDFNIHSYKSYSTYRYREYAYK